MQLLRQPLCKPVCPSNMPGQQGNRKPSVFIYYQYRRVQILAPDKGCDGTDRNACGSHKNYRVILCHGPLCKVPQAGIR